MYWVDGNMHEIYKANMDGTGTELFQHDMSEPEGISLDIEEGRYVWDTNIKNKNEINKRQSSDITCDIENT